MYRTTQTVYSQLWYVLVISGVAYSSPLGVVLRAQQLPSFQIKFCFRGGNKSAGIEVREQTTWRTFHDSKEFEFESISQLVL
jgi:hypothetical protein